MITRPGIVLLSLLISTSTWAANESQFAIKDSRQDSNGVTLRTVAGTMRIEVCGDRVVHVVASSRSEIPNPKVPIVTQPCRANNLRITVGKNDVRLSTVALTIVIDSENGAVSFFANDGTPVLAEPKGGGKTFDVPSLWETKSWQVQQAFLSPQMRLFMVWGNTRRAFSTFVEFQSAFTRRTRTSQFHFFCRAKDMAFFGTIPR